MIASFHVEIPPFPITAETEAKLLERIRQCVRLAESRGCRTMHFGLTTANRPDLWPPTAPDEVPAPAVDLNA